MREHVDLGVSEKRGIGKCARNYIGRHIRPQHQEKTLARIVVIADPGQREGEPRLVNYQLPWDSWSLPSETNIEPPQKSPSRLCFWKHIKFTADGPYLFTRRLKYSPHAHFQVRPVFTMTQNY